MEELKAYFEAAKGIGVMATADAEGKVDAALYSRPHFMQDGTVAFIMRDRLTHRNLQTNTRAVYLFVEEGPGYIGKRLYLTKLREGQDSRLIDSLSRRGYKHEKDAIRFLVFFKLDRALPLIGTDDEATASEV